MKKEITIIDRSWRCADKQKEVRVWMGEAKGWKSIFIGTETECELVVNAFKKVGYCRV